VVTEADRSRTNLRYDVPAAGRVFQRVSRKSAIEYLGKLGLQDHAAREGLLLTVEEQCELMASAASLSIPVILKSGNLPTVTIAACRFPSGKKSKPIHPRKSIKIKD